MKECYDVIKASVFHSVVDVCNVDGLHGRTVVAEREDVFKMELFTEENSG